MAFGDIDGVVVIPQAVAGTAIRAALDKVAAEDSTRAALLEGKSLREVYALSGPVSNMSEMDFCWPGKYQRHFKKRHAGPPRRHIDDFEDRSCPLS
jgi:hypothetical protein